MCTAGAELTTPNLSHLSNAKAEATPELPGTLADSDTT